MDATIETIWFDAMLSYTFVGQTVPPEWFRSSYVGLIRQPQPGKQKVQRYMLTPHATPDEIRTVSRVVHAEGNYALLRHPDGVLFTIIAQDLVHPESRSRP